jgi:hypothetical protein
MSIKTLVVELTVIVLALALMSSCGPKVTNLFKADGFEKEAVKQATVILGGVTSEISTLPFDVSEDSGAAEGLYKELRKQHPTLPIIRAEEVRGKLGEEDYEKLYRQYELNYAINAEIFDRLVESFPEKRFYFVMAQFTGDSRSHSKGKNEDSTGTLLNRYYQSWRELRGTFSVWESSKRQLVWQGELHAKDAATNSYDEVTEEWKFADVLGSVGEMMDVIAGPGDPPKGEEYPRWPNFTWVSRSVYGEFVKAFLD